MKRVLFVVYGDLEIGGIQTVIMSIVRHLHDRYVFDAVVTIDVRGKNAEEVLSYGGNIYCIPCRINDTSFKGRTDFYIRGNRIYRSFKKILKQHGPYDVVHSNFSEETGLFLKAAKEMNIPIRIYHRHGMHEKVGEINFIRNFYLNRLNKTLFKNATNLIGCSKAVCEEWF
ncbi:MAG: glycosyltransferase, partial [Oscillospiraceae bacterium]|nr:glycosyltransferase [Candidatus Equicaccousia limihippi]